MKKIFLFALAAICLSACKKDDETGTTNTNAKLRINFKFDDTQERLDNLGNPANLPTGHAAQTPNFKDLSVHFIEFVPNQLTTYRGGAEVYQGAEVPASNFNAFGFNTAINFDEAKLAADGELFYELPLNQIAPDTYEHLRVSVAYQNYDVQYNFINIPLLGNSLNETGTISSFLGYNTYISSIQPNTLTEEVNDFKLQGFWAFETSLTGVLSAYNDVYSGDAPQGSTTVVNPFPNSGVPPGTCVVAGSFASPLTLTGNESEDVEVTLSFSINNSFEWIDSNGNGSWDIDLDNGGPNGGIESVVDMGVRGLVGLVE